MKTEVPYALKFELHCGVPWMFTLERTDSSEKPQEVHFREVGYKGEGLYVQLGKTAYAFLSLLIAYKISRSDEPRFYFGGKVGRKLRDSVPKTGWLGGDAGKPLEECGRKMRKILRGSIRGGTQHMLIETNLLPRKNLRFYDEKREIRSEKELRKLADSCAKLLGEGRSGEQRPAPSDAPAARPSPQANQGFAAARAQLVADLFEDSQPKPDFSDTILNEREVFGDRVAGERKKDWSSVALYCHAAAVLDLNITGDVMTNLHGDYAANHGRMNDPLISPTLEEKVEHVRLEIAYQKLLPRKHLKPIERAKRLVEVDSALRAVSVALDTVTRVDLANCRLLLAHQDASSDYIAQLRQILRSEWQPYKVSSGTQVSSLWSASNILASVLLTATEHGALPNGELVELLTVSDKHNVSLSHRLLQPVVMPEMLSESGACDHSELKCRIMGALGALASFADGALDQEDICEESVATLARVRTVVESWLRADPAIRECQLPRHWDRMGAIFLLLAYGALTPKLLESRARMMSADN